MAIKRSTKPPPTFMYRVVLPALGLVVIVAFALGGVFLGFARLELRCEREAAGQPPTCEVQEIRFLGLYHRRQTVLEVSGVQYSKADEDGSTTVQLQGSNGPISLSRVAYNFGAWKADVIRKVRAFLDAKELPSLILTVQIRNLFGWIGLGFITSMLASCLVWAIRKLRGPGSKGHGE